MNIFDKNGYAIENTEVTLYGFNPEFTVKYTCTIYKGTGLPANSTLIEPPEAKEQFAIIWNGKNWEYTEDFRGLTAYNILNRSETEIKELGALPDNLTLLKPKSQFDKWNGSAWELDLEAQNESIIKQQESQKKQLLNEVKEEIEILQDTIDFDEHDEQDEAHLLALKKYRVQLNKVDTSVIDCEFPQKPVK